MDVNLELVILVLTSRGDEVMRSLYATPTQKVTCAFLCALRVAALSYVCLLGFRNPPNSYPGPALPKALLNN